MNSIKAQNSPALQASWATVWTYLGIVLGAVNFVLLLPRVLDVEEVGLIRLIAAGSLIFIKFAFFGLDTSAVRFLAGLEPKSQAYQKQWRLLLLLCVVGLFITVGPTALILFKQWTASGVESVGRGLAVALVLALCIGMLWQRFAESIAQVVGKTAPAAAWRDFVPRAAITAGVAGIALKLWDFSGLLILWSGSYLMGALWLNRSVREIGLYPRLFGPLPGQREVRETLRFAGYSFMGTAAASIQMTLDAVMLALLVGLGELGVYTPFAYAATLIMIPMRSLTAACYAQFRRAMRDSDLSAGRTLFTDISLLQLTTSGFIFIVLSINLPVLVSLLGGQAYAEGSAVLMVLGLGFWLEASLGQPSQVILSSSRYRLHGVINVVALLAGILLNWLLIPPLGMLGAAVATVITLLLASLAKAWIVWRHYRMHPFSKPYWIMLGLLLLLFFLNSHFPIQSERLNFETLIRTILVCMVLGGLAWRLNLLAPVRRLHRQSANKRLS